MQSDNARFPQRRWKVLLFGQAIAFASAFNNTLTYVLVVRLNVNLPIFEIFIMYTVLSIHLFYLPKITTNASESNNDNSSSNGDNNNSSNGDNPSASLETRRRLPFTNVRLKAPWWIYLAMAILDVEANFLSLLSLKYTSITSSTLLGSLTTPSTMLLASYFMARSFRLPHYVGVVLCLLGGAMTVYTDIGSGNGNTNTADSTTYPHALSGDILALLAAVMFAMGDTISEYFVKNFDRLEYLGMLGLFGAIVTLLQFPFLEYDGLYTLFVRTGWQQQLTVFGVMVVYVAGVLFYYVVATLFLVEGDVTLMELSLQASSLYAILLSIIAAHVAPALLFYPAMLLIVTGVFVYEVLGANRFFHDNDSVNGDDDNGSPTPLLAADPESSVESDPLEDPSLEQYHSFS